MGFRVSGERYTVKAVTDFLKIPPDRRDMALSEFGTWLKLIEAYSAICGPALKTPEAFDWIDDDKGEAHIALSVDDVEIYRSTRKMLKESAA